jgi:hypothetical protein
MRQIPLKKRPMLKFLTIKELEALNTKRLLGVLKSVRAIENAKQNKLMAPHNDEYDGFYLGKKAWDEMVAKPTANLTSYKNRIKKILSSREHIL